MPIRQTIKAKAEQCQRRLAAYLQQQWEPLPPRRKKITVLLYCVAVSAVCLAIIAGGLSGHSARSGLFRPVTVPGHPATLAPPGGAVPKDQIDTVVANQVRGFRHYLDGLQHSPAGKAMYDSLLLARPGLFDSLRQVEKIYHLDK